MNSGILSHIKVVQHPNDRIRTYHLTQQVSMVRGMYCFGDSMIGNYGDEKDKPGKDAQALSKILENLPGVESGYFRKYEISVSIADAFAWKDVGPLVLGEIVKAYYPEAVGQTILISTEVRWSYFTRSRSGFLDDDDSGQRTRERGVADRVETKIDFGAGRPRLDIEHLLDANALRTAQRLAEGEEIIIDRNEVKTISLSRCMSLFLTLQKVDGFDIPESHLQKPSELLAFARKTVADESLWRNRDGDIRMKLRELLADAVKV